MSPRDRLMQLSDSATNKASKVLDKPSDILDQTTRRSFLERVTLTATALAVGPVRFLIRPESAWAITCSNCPPSSSCCDQNSAFCCSLTGVGNFCPGGSSECGYWQCGTNNLYYIDCCTSTGCTCHCGNQSCAYRKSCCNPRFYSNCTGGATGPVVCRVTRQRRPDFCDFQCSTSFGPGNCDAPPACAQNPNC
jgi:hypothetical protein